MSPSSNCGAPVLVKWRYNRLSFSPPPACVHGQSPWGIDRKPESSALRARTPSQAADRTGTGSSCILPQSGGPAAVAASPADPYHLAACTFLGGRFCPLRRPLVLVHGINAMPFAAGNFV